VSFIPVVYGPLQPSLLAPMTNEPHRSVHVRFSVVVILLARLAVDVSIHGRGVGSALLKDALLRAANDADTISARALLVHAKDDGARAFREHFWLADVSAETCIHKYFRYAS
jgi:GNAT superfamily N-acetyltransferase